MMKMSIAGWIEAIAFAAMVMLYISGECGFVLIAVITVTALFSVISCAVSRKHFRVSCTGCQGIYHVGDKISVELRFTGEGFCLLPFITVGGRFLGEEFTARCSLLGGDGVVTITLPAQQCCLNSLEINEIVLRDFIGAVYFLSPVRPEPVAAAVLPRIVDYTGPEVPLSLLPSDDDEENGQSAVSGGMPGFEHREYVPGDPLRRINYKLSAKKHTLLVRRDENTAAESTDIIIAPGSDGSCAEQALALAQKLTSAGGTVRVICGGSSFTAGFLMMAALREWLAACDLSGTGEVHGQRSAAVIHTTVTISPAGVIIA